jgi:hypothetical protein
MYQSASIDLIFGFETLLQILNIAVKKIWEQVQTQTSSFLFIFS